jgi:putative Mg2+ transporter-C (MgtC) family protein
MTLPTLDPHFLATLTSLAVAFLLGTAIGAERQFRNRSAGLRTNALVALGAAAFVDLGMRLNDHQGAIQITSYVVSGIGFLGAGSILRDGATVRGLNTAATLWSTAAVGAFAGAGLLAEAAVLTFFALAGNTLLRPLVNGINRLPFNERTSEARYQVHLTARPEVSDGLRDALTEALEAASYPARDVRVYKRGEVMVEVVGTLLATAVDGRELDRVAETFGKRPDVAYATWTQRTMD